MRIETGGDPEGTLAMPAADAPGPVRGEDRREDDDSRAPTSNGGALSSANAVALIICKSGSGLSTRWTPCA